MYIYRHDGSSSLAPRPLQRGEPDLFRHVNPRESRPWHALRLRAGVCTFPWSGAAFLSHRSRTLHAQSASYVQADSVDIE